MAGGATEKADRQALTVRRVVEGQEQSLVLPLEAAVQPEDLIIVREGQRVYVTGEVKTPGRYAYETGSDDPAGADFGRGRDGEGGGQRRQTDPDDGAGGGDDGGPAGCCGLAGGHHPGRPRRATSFM
jgi:hypothetical protein